MKDRIYLDSAATTIPSGEVLKILPEFLEYSYGNPDSMHTLGIEAERAVELARQTIAATMGAQSGEIIFTSSGTEANNLAIFGAAEAKGRRGNKIIITDAEHPSVYMPALELEKKGFEIIYLSAAGGKIDLDGLKNNLDERVILISAMLVNNETGNIFDIGKIIQTAEESGQRDNLYIHCDAVQAYGKIQIDLNKLKIDMMSVSAHKIHGLKGAGALFLRRGKRIIPQIFGGGQENGMRSSSLNTPGIFTFGKAAKEAAENLQKNMEYIKSLYDYSVFKIKEKCPNAVFNQRGDISKYILSLRLPGIKSEVMLNYLSKRGIYVSSGSACSEKRKKKHGANRVLRSYGLDGAAAESTIRVSFSKYNDFSEIDEFAAALAEMDSTRRGTP